jgi:hypothetical protein
MQNHNGGLYVYDNPKQAELSGFPDNSVLENCDHVVVKCLVSGNYCRYENGKIAFSRVKPINIEKIC